MKDILKLSIILVGIVTISVMIFVFLIGWQAFIIGLSVLGLLIYGLGMAVIGAWWTDRVNDKSTERTIKATSKNDEFDTRKLEALSSLVEATVKGYATTQNSMLKSPHLIEYPALPEGQPKALRFSNSSFDELED